MQIATSSGAQPSQPIFSHASKSSGVPRIACIPLIVDEPPRPLPRQYSAGVWPDAASRPLDASLGITLRCKLRDFALKMMEFVSTGSALGQHLRKRPLVVVDDVTRPAARPPAVSAEKNNGNGTETERHEPVSRSGVWQAGAGVGAHIGEIMCSGRSAVRLSSPVSSMITSQGGASGSVRRRASTQPALPPPTMMTLRGLAMGGATINGSPVAEVCSKMTIRSHRAWRTSGVPQPARQLAQLVSDSVCAAARQPGSCTPRALSLAAPGSITSSPCPSPRPPSTSSPTRKPSRRRPCAKAHGMGDRRR